MNAEALPHQVRSAEEWSAWVQAIARTMPGPAELARLVDDPWGEPKQQTSPLAPETIASGLTPCAGNALRWIEVRERDGPSGGRWADVEPVEFDYRRTRTAVENTGHTIEMTPEPGNAIVLDGERYDLLQFHFHHRSEHLVGGNQFPLEMHLVHRNGGGELAVIGAPLTQGEANDALAPAWAHLPPDPGAPRAVSGELGLASPLPFVAHDMALHGLSDAAALHRGRRLDRAGRAAFDVGGADRRLRRHPSAQLAVRAAARRTRSLS